jgi:hypothetical protein
VIWHFDETRDITSWTTKNAYIQQTSPGVISIRGSDPFRIISPPDLNVPEESSHLEFRLKVFAPDLFGYILVKTADNKAWQERYSFDAPGRFNVYQVNLRSFVKSDAAIDSLVFAFGGIDRVEIDYIKFYRPSAISLIKHHWKQFWRVDPITGTAVNIIDTPTIMGKSFLEALYVVLIVLTVSIAVKLRSLDKNSIAKSLFLSFAVAGMLHAVRMDFQLYMQLREIQTTTSTKTVEELIINFDDNGAYVAARELKKKIPSGEKVRIYSRDSMFKRVLGYYLLPLMLSDTGNYIVVHGDSEAFFDSSRKRLIAGNRVVAENVLPVSVFDKGVYLYKINRTD